MIQSKGINPALIGTVQVLESSDSSNLIEMTWQECKQLVQD